MTNKTITKSELTKATAAFRQSYYDTNGTLADAFPRALDEIGFTIVDDPVAEPERTALVRDKDGDFWQWNAARSRWIDRDSGAVASWDRLLELYSPVEIYRKDS